MTNIKKNKKYYLGELIDTNLIIDNSNVLVISPTGSGKTHYIFEQLTQENKFKKCLYLCDNNYLKSSLELRDDVISNKKKNENKDLKLVEVMCYHSFGSKVRFNNDFIKKYDLIICDEIHNLISYFKMDCNLNLSHAIKELFSEHESTNIVYFTATPYYLKEIKKEVQKEFRIDIDRNVKRLDFTNHPNIMQYIELFKNYFSSSEHIPTIFKQNLRSIKYCNIKTLVYTPYINSMLVLEDELNQIEDIKPICLWSMNNKEYPMNEEQIKVKEHLLKTGKLLEPYNVLIINRSMETGVNITDEDMVYCITNTTNKTERIQARGRLRHDIIGWELRSKQTNDEKVIYQIELDTKWLNKPLTKNDKDMLCEELNIPNKNGKLTKWTGIKPKLEENLYTIKDEPIRIEGKQVRVSIITR